MDNYIRKLYYFIYLLFYRIYISFFPIAKQIHVPSILDLTNKYIEVRTKRFLESFDKTMDFNTNIEKEFYEKDKYKQLIMHPSNRLESNWKRRILFETTPRGNIIMYYDAYKQGFAYYSDSYNLPYGLLNTVAMKYVMTYCCRDFFMDDDITPDNKESPLIKIHMDEPEKKNDVKKNNMKKTLNRINTISKNFSEQKTQNNLNQKKSNPNIENIIITNTNRFIYLGKIINFNFLQSVSNVNTSLNGFGSNLLDNLVGETKLQKSVMDYKEYKNLRNRKVETSW